MKILDPGTLDQRVVFQAKNVARNSLNEPVETWTDFLDCYASVNIKGADEKVIGERNVLVNTYDIFVRYDTSILNTMRVKIVCDGTFIQIAGILSNRRDGYMSIIGKQVNI